MPVLAPAQAVDALPTPRNFDANPEVSTVTCVADSAGSLNNKYFTLMNNATAYYCWFNVNSAGVDPAPGGTGVEVALATNASAATVSTAVATALSASAFDADVVGTTVKIASNASVNATDVAAGDSGFTVSVAHQGSALRNQIGSVNQNPGSLTNAPSVIS